MAVSGKLVGAACAPPRAEEGFQHSKKGEELHKAMEETKYGGVTDETTHTANDTCTTTMEETPQEDDDKEERDYNSHPPVGRSHRWVEKEYENMRHWELLKYHFGCIASEFAEDQDTDLKIFSDEEFERAKEIYVQVVGEERSTISKTEKSLHVPVTVKIVEGKGRGLFTTAPVKKGQLVWSRDELASFYNGQDFREFLKRIGKDLACGVLQWAWCQDISDGKGILSINVGLDPGSFMNQPDWYYDEDGEEQSDNLNVGCVPEFYDPGDCVSNLYALRDLEAEEEILVDYSTFALTTGWRYFGL